MSPLSQSLWTACRSALLLDRWRAGELAAAEAAELKTHVDGCASCAAAVSGLRAAEAEALPPLRLLPLRALDSLRPPSASLPNLLPLRARRLTAAIAGAAGLLAAAGVLFVLRAAPGQPGDSGQRVKGPGYGLSMYVQHGTYVRRAAPGETVAPGDAIRFAVTTPERAFVAVLSVDPSGRGSVYFPVGARAEPVAAGTEVPLPLGTRLDATVGEERLLGLFCDQAIELEPVRRALETGAGAAIPAGCQATQWRFVKRP